MITGVSFGSAITDCTMTLSDASTFNCCAIRWVKSTSLMMPTYGLGIFWKYVYYNQFSKAAKSSHKNILNETAIIKSTVHWYYITTNQLGTFYTINLIKVHLRTVVQWSKKWTWIMNLSRFSIRYEVWLYSLYCLQNHNLITGKLYYLEQ